MEKKQSKLGVIRELTDLLSQLKIGDFVLDAHSIPPSLKLEYKEDFDRFFPKLNGEPRVLRGDTTEGRYLPYGATHYASFDYRGWRISGNITHHKPQKKS